MAPRNLLLFYIVLCTLFTNVLTWEMEHDYEKCTVNLEMKVIDSQCNSTGFPECANFSVCQKVFNIVQLDRKPFSSDIISNDLLRTCCGDCVTTNNIATVKKISEISPDIKNITHFIFPVLGRRDLSVMHGYHFLPVIDTPNIFYIAHNKKDLMKSLIMHCLEMWPLMIICVLMVVISGFLCWLMETRGNEEEFPRKFMVGWFEGIWWSFISMTTVGYGDKAPKSIAARIFSIIWIIVGITTFSIVTAMLTSEIFKANARPPPRMQMVDARVGVVKDHMYEKILISNHGGILIEVDRDNITDGVNKLVSLLHLSEIDGFVLDGYELMMFFDVYKDHPIYKDDINYIRSHTMVTEIEHLDNLVYGILAKYEEDYEFLVDFLLSNHDVIDSCTNLFLNSYSRKVKVKQYQVKTSLFSVEGAFFLPTLVACAVLIFLIFACGATYEMKKKPGSFPLPKNLLHICEKEKEKSAKFFEFSYRRTDDNGRTKNEEPLVPTTEKNIFGKV